LFIGEQFSIVYVLQGAIIFTRGRCGASFEVNEERIFIQFFLSHPAVRIHETMDKSLAMEMF
jgi:hypothetical protein